MCHLLQLQGTSVASQEFVTRVLALPVGGQSFSPDIRLLRFKSFSPSSGPLHCVRGYDFDATENFRTSPKIASAGYISVCKGEDKAGGPTPKLKETDELLKEGPGGVP